jgi:hypothetical protein
MATVEIGIDGRAEPVAILEQHAHAAVDPVAARSQPDRTGRIEGAALLFEQDADGGARIGLWLL